MKKILFLIISISAYSSEILIPTLKPWYPPKKEKLKIAIYKYIKNAPTKSYTKTVGIIVPHAGYIYSGKTAAKAYATTINNNYSRVIILGPSHHHYLLNKIAIPKSKIYQSVLGKSVIDHSFFKSIIKNKYFIQSDKYFLNEHSIDNQIPFIQYLTPKAKIIPLIVGHFDIKNIRQVAKLLKPKLNSKTLIVVSSDFTHFGKNFNYTPFTKNIKTNLKKLDEQASNLISSRDIKEFWKYKAKTKNTICGFFPIALFLELLPNKTTGELLEYSTSGEITGDYSNSVSYMSFTFQGDYQMNSNNLTPFSNEDKKNMLVYARKQLESYLQTGKKITLTDLGFKITPAYEQHTGGFVTLHKNGELRGCIGEIFPTRSSINVVSDRAIDAAVSDPRFPPVTSQELKEIDIEISILTPPVAVKSYQDIEIGKHGMVLHSGHKSAVFLPQVAPEQGWDLETTLKHLAIKAGLSSEAWKDPSTSYEVFEAIIFNEKNR